jgi:mannose-6-phosphate isomerase-like protein (cupin superfamily)
MNTAMTLDSDQDLKTGSDSARKRMTIFRAADATDVQEFMPLVGVDESVQAGFAKMMAIGAKAGSGESAVCVFREPGEKGLSLCHAWFKSNYVLVKHSHDADCVYYVIAGELHAGAAVLKAGDGIFVPCDHPYTFTAGPEGVEFVEFRNATQFHINLKGNDEAHWDKIAATYRDNKEKWENETVPPSKRAKAPA